MREANRHKDLFLATLAHELRNPLAPIRTGLDVLLRHPERPVSLDGTLSAMNRQLDTMVRLIDDLLDMSRISRGNLEIRRAPAELSAAIELAIETIAPSFARRNQRVTLDRAELVTALVDVTRISQIVANLLNNASKWSPSGGQVWVHLERAGDNAVIRVVDEGAGIPADQMPRLFDMFTKLQRSGNRDSGGLGIGLALSRHLAELHGGTLTAESAGEGKGATFTLVVPTGIAVPRAPAPPVSLASAPSDAANAEAAARLHIVVVEDNDDSADMMALWLKQLGHDVQIARTGPDGLSLILETRPDLVLCDVGLPEMDGVEVCRRVVEGLEQPPVMIALTGWGMDADRGRTRQAGFHHHLVKPVDLEKLRSVLTSVHARRVAGA